MYGFRSTHPGPIECELVGAQNALIRQSRRDSRGLSNLDGWGIGLVQDGAVRCVRQAGPAFESEEFREEARRARTSAVVAHVRRATIGGRLLENTHPFRHGDQLLAHNGHIASFGRLRSRLMEETSPAHRRAIAGDTDSEHFFHFLLSRAELAPGGERSEVLREAVRLVEGWVAALAPPDRAAPSTVRQGAEGEDEVALNVLWLTPEELTGSRRGRTLWYVERERPHVCEVHGTPHVSPRPDEEYRAVVVAPDPITSEEWNELPEGCVFAVGEDARLRVRPLVPGSRVAPELASRSPSRTRRRHR